MDGALEQTGLLPQIAKHHVEFVLDQVVHLGRDVDPTRASRARTVASSSSDISRLYPTTSADKIAASLCSAVWELNGRFSPR